MKIKRTWIVIFLTAVAACAALAFQNPAQYEVLFEKARFTMETKGDLKGAINIFDEIVQKYPDVPDYAAKSLYLMGTCYEKLGEQQAQQARAAFERIVQDYPNQTEEVRLARDKLQAQQAVMDQKGEGPTIRQVWSGPVTDASGAVSPDGRYLCFADWTTSDLAVRDMATGEVRRLTSKEGSPPGSYEAPGASIWAPDSRQIAYHWYSSDLNLSDLRLVGIDGSKPRVLYHGTYQDWVSTCDWSPDGRYILAKLGTRFGLISVADGSFSALRTMSGCGRFSPDGRYIIYDTPQAEGAVDRDIHVMSIEDADDRLLIEHAADDSVLGWAPDGKSILFLSDRTGSPCFWLQTVVDGKPEGSAQMIRAASRRTVPLGFTRDGRFFYGESKAGSDVYTVRLEPATGKVLGPPEKLVERYEGFNYWPSYSTDGKYLAYYTGYVRGGNALCILNQETGEVQDFSPEFRRLGFDLSTRPHWSPDDRSIAVYSSKIDGSAGIYRIDIQTGDIIPVVEGGTDFKAGPVISIDANTLLYQRRDKKSNRVQFVTRNIQNGNEKIIYTFSGSENPLFPERSPNGKWLCYLSNDVFYIMAPTGEEPRKIYEITGQEGLPNRFSWAADSEHILFTRTKEGVGWQLWRLPIDGGRPKKLGLALPSYIRSLSAHPDGQHIAFSHGALGGADIWVMENCLTQGR
jgi:Tol biopolymer transport system component